MDRTENTNRRRTTMTRIPAAPLMLVTTAHPSLHEHPGPAGEAVHPQLGRLIQPRHTSSIEATAAAGIPWAADNDCFQGLDERAFRAMVDRVTGLPGCLFVTVPDVVGDAAATAAQFDAWAPELEARGIPVALVLQDGLDEPELAAWLERTWHRLAAVFVGGTDDFKLGELAADLAREAKARGKWVHWGRVNTRRRMDHIAATGAADSFDGSSWAIFRKAVANKRTGERKLEQGLRWCGELAAAAAAALREAPASITVGGRELAPVAGGSPELDELELMGAGTPADMYIGSHENADRRTTMTTAPSLTELLERNDERRREDRAAFVKARAELTILERFDDHRRYAYGDYGGGQRWHELSRRRGELERLRVSAELGAGAVLGEPTRLELVAAFDRVARPKVKRLIRDMERCGRTRSSGATLKAWRCVAAELELRIDNPTR